MCTRTALVVVVVMLSISSLTTAQPSFRGLDNYSAALAVSADGTTVVGVVSGQAFRWRAAEGMVLLGYMPQPFNDESVAYAVSADGSVVVGNGRDYDQKQYPQYGFRWTASEGMIPIGPPPLSGALDGTSALGVSGNGEVVVGYTDVLPGFFSFRWTVRDGMIGIPLPFVFGSGISSDGNVLIGRTNSPFAFGAASWTIAEGTRFLGDLPGGGNRGETFATNTDGSVIVGNSSSVNTWLGGYEAFRWTVQTGMQGLGDLPGGGFSSTALAVSGDGSIVVGHGWSEQSVYPYRDAFIWDANHGMRRLVDVLTNDYGLNLTGWTLFAGRGISADGRTIVGDGRNPSGVGQAWVAYLGPPPPPCPADFNADGFANSQDFFDFLTAFFTIPTCPQPCPGELGCPADFNHDCLVNTADFFDFLTAFFAGC